MENGKISYQTPLLFRPETHENPTRESHQEASLREGEMKKVEFWEMASAEQGPKQIKID